MHSSSGQRPVFYDESRKRWAWTIRLTALALFLASIGLICLVISILALPLLPHNVLPRTKQLVESGKTEPVMNDHQRARKQFAQKRDKAEMVRLMAQERETLKKKLRDRPAQALYGPPALPPGAPIVAGFYVNWEETSRASLRRNIDEITHLFPEWLHLSHEGTAFSDLRNEEDKADIEPFVRRHKVPILPILNNFIPKQAGTEEADWNPAAVHKLVSDRKNRTRFIAGLKKYLLDHKWAGINVDLEKVDMVDRDPLVAFMQELYASFHPAGLLVTEDIQVDDDAIDVTRLAKANDYIVPMFYDQHSPGEPEGAGSVAGIGWTEMWLKQVLAKVPASKVIMGLGSYAYDWKKDDLDAATLSYQDAVLLAKESVDPKDKSVAHIAIDQDTLNPTFKYYDDDGTIHHVWMMDATTAYNQWALARPKNPRGVALWYMGSEDPAIWNVIGRHHLMGDLAKDVKGGALDKLSYKRQSEVDFEGEGELLEVLAEPNEGERRVELDAASGFITGEAYKAYPSAYIVRRYGYQPKKVILTFDDGPDPVYTPQILDVLKREGVRAAFFVVGKQAEENPELVGRIWAEGHEIGNHTYWHPNLAEQSRARARLEISTTQRVIESITGHSTTLFRPPYAIDVEPRTGGELKPIIEASKTGFISVGEKNDPQDWNLIKKLPDGTTGVRTAEDIARSVWVNRNEGNIVLLHDGGGDRRATVEALPEIIRKLKAGGYQFTTIAALRGLPRSAMFPSFKGREEALVGVDKWVFESLYLTQRTLTTLFLLSIVLGISRQCWLTALALIRRRREKREAMIPEPLLAYSPLVSVIIAAYNEEKVICRTIGSILDSDYQKLEVIVVDDGSRDGTYDVVSTAFANEPAVVTMQKENGGKASALNVGLAKAQGEIIVALDADTLFARDAISKLVHHFDDPQVGAVSGNVRVGNVHNVLTKWQALEYVTSQNYDRRAYDLLNCITVVPGAIGAWRREAIEQVGGYTSDTLAEDTDLTWKIRRAGWKIENDTLALAFTEAPETLGNLTRQRFRWAFGTLQCLVKHRSAAFRNGAFGWIALPSLWVYQILFPAISPIMDLVVVFSLFAGNAPQVIGYYAMMVCAEAMGAAVAIRMDRADWKLLPWLFVQRLVYRQLMYYVILKSVVAAIRGGAVGWNKFDRTGSVEALTTEAAAN